ncbi:MAG: hypothetical protein ABIP53_07205 [Candidatus Limnocylindrales bacterium]
MEAFWDTRFRLAVELSYGAADVDPILGDELLGAVAALLRSTYPLATVEMRAIPGPHRDALAWDASRESAVLDDELARRARAGQSDAMEQLYDRHYRLVYAIAEGTAQGSTGAAAAVIDAFRALIAKDDRHLTVRVRVARAARDAALARGDPVSNTHGRRSPCTDEQWMVLDLAYNHRLLRTEIATVLRVEIGEVCRLANDGLIALKESRGVERGVERRVDLD